MLVITRAAAQILHAQHQDLRSKERGAHQQTVVRINALITTKSAQRAGLDVGHHVSGSEATSHAQGAIEPQRAAQIHMRDTPYEQRRELRRKEA